MVADDFLEFLKLKRHCGFCFWINDLREIHDKDGQVVRALANVQNFVSELVCCFFGVRSVVYSFSHLLVAHEVEQSVAGSYQPLILGCSWYGLHIGAENDPRLMKSGIAKGPGWFKP